LFFIVLLEFWENWYVIGENDKDMPEFKFIYYNGKTRQNTYEGAFVYSRTKELSPESMKKVYQIALEAGMDPKQFCRIQNGCFADDVNLLRKDNTGLGSPSNPFRGILASTRVSQLLGVEPVAARDLLRRNTPTASVLTPEPTMASSETLMMASTRKWWHEIGDYLENPHRHFEAMEKLRQPIVWPEDVLKAAR
jgi:VDE lipocalin domain